MARLTFLGSGTSTGIPMLGCPCPICTSKDPRDQRWRASVAIEEGETRIIIDATPEFRLQCLRAGINRMDALFITHDHADHINGLDDVRSFTFRMDAPLPVYADAPTAGEIRQRFRYIWNRNHVGGGLPRIAVQILTGPVTVGDLTVEPLEVLHGPKPIQAYRLGTLAYVTDVSAIPEATRPRLENLDVLILDAVRYTPHPTHFSIEEALAAIAELKPRQAWLTHLNHEIGHAQDEAKMPPGVHLAWDGLTVEFDAQAGRPETP